MKKIGNYIFLYAALFDPETNSLFQGYRHHEIMRRLREEGYPSNTVKRYKQGFIIVYKDNFRHQFISREEATEIAKDNNYSMIGSVLTSEDLW